MLGLLQDLMEQALKLGAHEAQVSAVEGKTAAIGCREGQFEEATFAETMTVTLRVLVDQKQACVSTNTFAPSQGAHIAKQAIEMAKVLPVDPYCGLAPSGLDQSRTLEVATWDPYELDPARGQEIALACEEAARSISGVTNSCGAQISWEKQKGALVASNGFQGQQASSAFSLAVNVIAGSAETKQQDGYFSTAVFFEDVANPLTVGQEAGRRAVSRLHPRKIKTCQVPVVFDALMSASLMRVLVQAISGTAIVRQNSFLQDAKGEVIFPPHVCVIDDPFLPRGFGSQAFDGEGLCGQKRYVIEEGVLQTWLLNLHTARQLGELSTAHATWALGGPPRIAPSNLYMEPGLLSPKDLIGEIDSGLFVTALMGHGVNLVTGDYSMGASGFWIEKGQVSYPVSEVTIAGNLKQMFATCTPADDLIFRGSINAPTLRVEMMTIGGH